jgi:cell division cycle protein 37
MSKPISYAQWKNMEISDDEDETHPNIHKPSLDKWRHEARLQRREKRLEKQHEHEKQRQE